LALGHWLLAWSVCLKQQQFSARSAFSAVKSLYYFFAGAAGAAGCVCAGIPCNTDFEALAWRDAYTESVIEVTIKMMADQVVARDKAVAAPRGPNAVWLPMPPNAAVMSPLLPLCSSTTMIRNKQTII
jgi:hypothetical protein